MSNKNKEITVRPKQERSIISRQKILDAAETVFSEKGLHGARIDEIAKLSNVNKQRIYAYFGSKDSLYRQVLLNVYSLAAKNEKIMAMTENDIPNMTMITLKAFFDFHEKHPEFWRLLAWENLSKGENLTKTDWNNIKTAYIDYLEKLYAKGQEKGLFKKEINFSTYLMMIFAATYFYFSNQTTISHLLNLQLANRKLRKKIADQINQTILSGIQL